MTFFGLKLQKKTRIARRAGIGTSLTLFGRLRQSVRSRSVLFRLFLCLSAIVGMIVVVEAWKVPFTFRLGDHVSHGLLARINFRRINRIETDRAKFELGDQAPPVFDLFERGTLLAEPEQVINEEKLKLLEAEHAEQEKHVPFQERVIRVALVFLMLLILTLLNGHYLVKNESRLVASSGRLCVLLLSVDYRRCTRPDVVL